jgi:glycerate 2-kinase
VRWVRVIIKNWDELTSHGDRRGRETALAILEAGLQAADPYANVRELVRLEGDRLFVGRPEMDVSGLGEEVIDLSGVRNIYVIGAGKAVQRQALALEDVLGDRLTAGAITAKKGEGCYLERIEVTEGAHPVPDEDSLEGARRILEIARSATEDDLVFTIFSDGCSSLFPFPRPDYSLDELRQLYRLAIEHGNQEIIVWVMPFFSQVNAGRIVAEAHPARTINLITCTVTYQRWHRKLHRGGCFVSSWPPGAKSMRQWAAALQQQPWWGEVPVRMRFALERQDPACELPDLDRFREMRWSYWQPVDAEQMLLAAKRKSEELGVHGAILGRWSLANCGEVAHFVSGMARQIALGGQPFEPPVALISTGELTVPVGNAEGIGGRNQEFVLAAALRLGRDEDSALYNGLPLGEKMVVASVDSDGTDGPGTQFSVNAPEDFRCMAGGVVDGQTLSRAREMGIDIPAELKNHNSSMPLWRLGDSIYTGNTGSCVGDLRVLLVPERYHGEGI